jgi:DNA repair protein RadD
MPAQKLRDYQSRGLAQILAAYKQGARSVLAVSPTGSGKTTLFGHLTAQLTAPVLINVHRRELAAQAGNRLREFGVDFGVIMSGEIPKPYARVQVSMVQTLVRRARFPRAGLVINDEAHLSTANTWQTILDQYPSARILGVTATPWRLGGKPLAGAYDAVVVVATPAELREQGHLCQYVGFSYKTPDLSDVKTTGGDYNEQQTAAAMSTSLIVDNVVEEWLKHARELSTVVFAVTVEHSKTLTERFRAAGVAAEHLDGSTSVDERRAILRRVESGQTRVLCNVGVAVEGLDIPRLKCCVLARPTKSLARAIQMMGRVRRPWQGVTARIHDHAFVIKQHGLPDADRDYALDAKPEAPPSLTTCAQCLALYSGDRCPSCDSVNESMPAGERVLNTVADAEQYGFASGEEEAAPVARPPVTVRWDTVDRMIEGVLSKTWEEPADYGPQRRYLITGGKRDYVLPGTTRLNALMSRVATGTLVRVTYKGETALPGGRSRKEFAVAVDDGKPLQDRKAEAARLYSSGETAYEIARALDVHRSTVERWIASVGVPMRSKQESMGGSPERDAEIKARYERGEGLKTIAKAIGTGHSSVVRVLDRLGIPRRGESAQ